MNENSIILDYFRITKEYQAKYGKSLVLLMQVGAFFEVYALKNPYTNTHEVTEIDAFSEICNLIIAEKSFSIGNDSVRTPSNIPPLIGYDSKSVSQWMKTIPRCKVVMAGHSIAKLDQYVQKLTDNGVTAVVYVQEKDAYDKVIDRKLLAVYSPGTFLGSDTEYSTQRLSNNIMCIWLEKTNPNLLSKLPMLYCGISAINMFTGESSLFEYNIPYDLNPTTFDELERITTTSTPSEVILISNLDTVTRNKILQYTGIPLQTTIHNIDCNDSKAVNSTKQTYIDQILTIVFGSETFAKCYEFQENIFATQAFCFLLNFVQEHNPDLIRKIALPTLSKTSHRVIMANHTLTQLNIIDDKSNTYHVSRRLTSVANFLNRCCTAMGRRKFVYQLTNPTFDTEWLNTEYSMIHHIQSSWGDPNISDLRRVLSNICDIEKSCRQIITKRFLPSSIPILYKTLKDVKQIHSMFVNDDQLQSYLDANLGDFSENLLGIISFLESHFIIETCTNSFDNNFIHSGVSVHLDDCLTRRNTILQLLDVLQTTLNAHICKEVPGIKESCIKLNETEKSGKSFQITKKRSISWKKALEKLGGNSLHIKSETTTYTIPLKDIVLVNASSNYDRISFPLLNETTQELLSMENNMSQILSETYQQVLVELETSWYSFLETVARYISKLDVIINKVYIANEYQYCKPHIVDNESYTKSFVSAEGLRHCLIEHLQTNETYVTNDISIGDDQDGILLYGTNAVGKTSIIRALGIAIVMAQAGCYVPCSQFTYIPYKSIYSRILGNDNLFKGLSTFAVEMSELRVILKMADEYSLVLGDELCSGTENESALSIFASGLIQLHNKHASFIFATHFHDILDFDEVNALSRLSTKHMSVSYDREQDCLVYDRILKDGPGNRMYGLEVCKSLHLPDDFLEQAYVIRNKYYSDTQSVLSQSSSRYNSKKLLGVCEICKQTMGEEIHHIQYQQHADSKGYIGHVHKNHSANLMSICSKCHDEIHSKDDISPLTSAESTKTKTPRIKKKTTRGYQIV
jgi:DNA mismatch repair protein MutS